MSNNLLRTAQEQQETIERQQETIEQQSRLIKKQSKLIADLIVTLENWENVARYDGTELKERAAILQESEEI